jgi:hypothetical protein
VFDRLFGSRMLIANAELLDPIIVLSDVHRDG